MKRSEKISLWSLFAGVAVGIAFYRYVLDNFWFAFIVGLLFFSAIYKAAIDNKAKTTIIDAKALQSERTK